MSDIKDAQERAIRATLREERAREAARALQEVELERQSALTKTARLRALRLAQASDDVPAPKRRKPE